MRSKTITFLAVCLPFAVFFPPHVASAAPIGTCPSDYMSMDRHDVEQLSDADLALIAYESVNHNGDDLVCYRAYRNGPHNGGYTGNFIDNTAAPHQ